MRLPLLGLLAATSLAATAAEPDPIEITVFGESDKPTKPDTSFRPSPADLAVVDFRFPSGLRVMFQRDPTEPIVAITAVTDHGSSDDPLGKEGIAHLVEHLWFRSEHGDLPKLWDILESEMGCDLNAFTQNDITAYMTSCASQNLEAMMKFESLRITDTVRGVTEDMVTTEVEVVRNEIRMRSENFNIPFFTIFEFINKHTYPEGHPYHRPIAGDHTTIRNCKLADIQQFTESYYVPADTTIMVVGDLPTDDVGYLLDLVVRTFDLSLLDKDLKPENVARVARPGIAKPDPAVPAHWYLLPMDPKNPGKVLPYTVDRPARSKAFANLIPSDPASKKLGVYEGPVKHPTVAVSWTLPPGYQGYDTLVQVTGNVVSNVVGAGLDALQNDDIKEFIGCGAIPSKRSTTVLCAAELESEDANAEQVADQMIDQLITLTASGSISYPDPDSGQLVEIDAKIFLKQQFGFARQQFLAGIYNSLDVYANIGSGRATNTAQHAHFTGSAKYFADSMNEVMKLTVEQVIDTTSKWIRRDRAAMVFVKPLPRDEVALMSEDTAGAGGHYRGGDEASVLNPSVDVKALNPGVLRGEMSLPEVEKLEDFKLPNGLRVVILPHSTAPLVDVHLIARGGSASDGQGLFELRQRFVRFEGGSLFAPNQPLQVAGGWQDEASTTHETLGVRGNDKNLDGLIWMLRYRLDTLKPNLEGKSSWITRLRKDFKKDWYDDEWHVADMRTEHLNPNHPLNDGIDWEDLTFLSSVSQSQLGDSLFQTWQPSNSTLLIVGRINPDEARKLAIQYFGGWKTKPGIQAGAAPLVPGPNPSKDRAIYVFDDEGKTQTEVTLACPLKPTTTSPSTPHQLLGDLARTTLFAKLREEAGVVYSPQAAVFAQPGGTATMFMTAAIQNDSAVFAMERYFEYLDDTVNKRLSDSDLRLKKLARARGYVLDHQSIDQMTARLTSTVALDQPWSSFDSYAKSLSEVELDDLADIAEGCAEHAFVSFVGPKDKITAQLDKGGFSYEVVDTEARGDAIYKAKDPKAFEKHAKDRAKKKAKEEKEKAKKEAEEKAEGGSAEPAPEPSEPAPAPEAVAHRD